MKMGRSEVIEASDAFEDSQALARPLRRILVKYKVPWTKAYASKGPQPSFQPEKEGATIALDQEHWSVDISDTLAPGKVTLQDREKVWELLQAVPLQDVPTAIVALGDIIEEELTIPAIKIQVPLLFKEPGKEIREIFKPGALYNICAEPVTCCLTPTKVEIRAQAKQVRWVKMNIHERPDEARKKFVQLFKKQFDGTSPIYGRGAPKQNKVEAKKPATKQKRKEYDDELTDAFKDIIKVLAPTIVMHSPVQRLVRGGAHEGQRTLSCIFAIGSSTAENVFLPASGNKNVTFQGSF